ncbi:hypothetical protein MOPEL_067_00040 [Mobilicoccus pelagius NBRC 104925]|uniref:Uncharacterized protein n=1 Tax=Mobilicoccus pelagius NBRC 104925 TaxID=1089455 RepID=H5UQZ7_9MICO|nr:hypothetical protein MOPEL_067_00040 [Mobilicoccus pelagius NBRC 104925]
MLLADIDETAVPEHSAAQMITRNIATVRQAVETLATRTQWTAGQIDDMHHTLLPTQPRGFRDRWVWISGSSPVRAKYVAPHPEQVAGLMDDLATYLETTDDPPLVQATRARCTARASTHEGPTSLGCGGRSDDRSGYSGERALIDRRVKPRPPMVVLMPAAEDSGSDVGLSAVHATCHRAGRREQLRRGDRNLQRPGGSSSDVGSRSACPRPT